ncbi:MAG: POTRA domain-containing protein [Pseudomonadota bacterium]
MRVLERWDVKSLARNIFCLAGFVGFSAASAGPVGSTAPGSPQQQFSDPAQLEIEGRQPTGTGETLPDTGLDAETAATEFDLRDVNFVGVTKFAVAELRSDWSALIGRRVTVGEVYEKTNALRAAYRNEGYLLAQVVTNVDPEAGVVTVDVIEGDVGAVNFQRGVTGRDGMLDAIGERIAESSPLDVNVLERELLRLNDLPGVTAYVIPEGPQVVGQNARLDVYMDHKTIDFEVGVRNRASELIGPEQYDLTWNFNSLFRAYENTQLRFVTSGDERLRFGSIDHTQVLGSKGTRLTLSYATSSSEPDLGTDFSQFNLVTDNDSASIGLTFPVKRSRASNLSFRTRLTYQESVTDETGFTLTEDNIAALRVGVTYDRIDQWFGGRGLNLIDFEVSQGIDALSSSEPDSPLSSRSGGQP